MAFNDGSGGINAAVNNRLDSLTGVRFFAALFVFFFHASLTKIIGFNPYENKDVVDVFQAIFLPGGWLGVSFFFVLSGFVITWSYKESDSVGSFLRRRLVKIYPNHLVTWLLALLVAGFGNGDILTPALNLLLVHAWVPDNHVFLSVNTPSWSLCSELLFYVTFPFWMQLVVRIRRGHLWGWTLAMVAGLAVYQILIACFVPSEPQLAAYPISMKQWWIAYYLPPGRLFEFIIGMLMARILKENMWPDISLRSTFILLCVSYVVAGLVPFQWRLNLVTLLPVTLFIAALADHELKGKRLFLSSPLFVKLGEISFGLYLVHRIVMTCGIKLMAGRLFDTLTATMILTAAFLVSLLGAWALFTFVEAPAMKYWSRPAGKRVLQEAAAVAGGQ
ncbi:MAG: acyltransferase [Telmatospirillum sp.]|nr:acyltransferase [Telmatospirillum sp.]